MVGAVVEVFYPLRRLSMMTPYCRFPTTEALVQSVLPFGFLSGFCLRSVPRGGCCSRSALGGTAVRDQCWGAAMRDWRMGGGGEWCCARKRERESRKGGGERLQHFGKRFTKFFFFDYVRKGSLHLILMQHINMGIQVPQAQRT
jgi:hypothetical protein